MEARRTRMLRADPEAVWAVVSDPHHFPRWWPGVVRVEGVGDQRFTHVYTTKKGRAVRIDFRLLASEPPDGGSPGHRSWAQEIAGTPFERVLREAVTEIQVAHADTGGTRVTIAQRQKLRGYSRTGGWLLRRATRTRLDEALAGLERICG
jgi:carbon monoxide dehydrogenase subunit G